MCMCFCLSFFDQHGKCKKKKKHASEGVPTPPRTPAPLLRKRKTDYTNDTVCKKKNKTT